MKAVERIYLRSPLWAKKALLNAQAYRIHRRRYNKNFDNTFGKARDREYLDRKRIDDLQRTRLEAFLGTASRTVYWGRVFNERGVRISPDTDPFENLRKLPLLDKRRVRENIHAIQSSDIPSRRLIDRQTSGTTGAGLRFVETVQCEQETWAVWWRYRFRHGIDMHRKCGYFGGRTVLPAHTEKPPFWIVNRIWNQVLFSAYHLSARNTESYVDEIRTRGIEWLHGYPSMISMLAGFMKAGEIQPLENVKIITFGAESVSERQKAIVREMFPMAHLSEHYGLAEGVANISQCELGKLHVDEDFSFVEFVEVDGTQDVYELVGTNWSNEAFPLFRYRTGDLVQIDDTRCYCGRDTRVVCEIDGRREDVIQLTDGRAVGRMDHIFKDMVNILEAQIHQVSRNEIDLHVVASRQYSRDDEEKLRSNLSERLGDDFEVRFHYVDRLAREGSGKLKFVVSHL